MLESKKNRPPTGQRLTEPLQIKNLLHREKVNMELAKEERKKKGNLPWM